jgi:transcriptional regulator with GAF, ATPase, and Fis domain
VSVLPRYQELRLIGRSEGLRNLETDLECAARSDAKVLITGETGVGKELVARLIKERSARASAPLVTLNCAGLPDSLLESELFGHARGSFTGAYRDKPGLLEMAPNGTVFLDEVGEMSMRMQVVLLRFLETGEIQRVGGDRPQGRVNVRLITATNRDLQAGIQAGTFREDLYFRLNVIRLSIPPLRERIEDIPLLLDHYARSYAQLHRTTLSEIPGDVMEALLAYRWPGNIRELKNVVERMILKAGSRPITYSHLPPEILRGSSTSSPDNGHAVPRSTRGDELAEQMLNGRESFWSAVYPLFMSRDITRSDLRRVVQIGLERTSGNYRSLVQLFNMPVEDYKRFLSFLRKHDCHLPFQRFRAVPARYQSPEPPRAAAGGA